MFSEEVYLHLHWTGVGAGEPGKVGELASFAEGPQGWRCSLVPLPGAEVSPSPRRLPAYCVFQRSISHRKGSFSKQDFMMHFWESAKRKRSPPWGTPQAMQSRIFVHPGEKEPQTWLGSEWSRAVSPSWLLWEQPSVVSLYSNGAAVQWESSCRSLARQVEEAPPLSGAQGG